MLVVLYSDNLDNNAIVIATEYVYLKNSGWGYTLKIKSSLDPPPSNSGVKFPKFAKQDLTTGLAERIKWGSLEQSPSWNRNSCHFEVRDLLLTPD